MKFFVFFTLIALINCSSSERQAEKMSMLCEMHPKNLEEYNVILLLKDEEALKVSEVEKSSFQINSNGCAIIPKGSSKPLTVKSGKLGINLTQEEIEEGFSIVHLQTLLDDFDIWAQCGMNAGPNKRFFHFEGDVNNPLYFQTTDSRLTPLEINEYNCASAPNQKGRIISATSSTVIDNKTNFLDLKIEDYPSGFLQVCEQKGKKDKIIDIVSSFLQENRCEHMLNRINEVDGTSIFVEQEITKVNALHGVALKEIDLQGNNIKEVSGLSDSVQSLDLINNPVMFIDELPASLRFLSLENAPNLQDASALASPKNLSELSIRETPNLKEVRLNPNTQILKIKIENSPLEVLEMDWSEVGYVSAFESSFQGFSSVHLPKLFHAELTYNNIEIAKKNPANLEMVYLDFLPASPDLAFLTHSTKLQFLQLDGKISDISTLYNVQMRSLNMAGTNVSDLKPLSNSASLESLNISGTDVTDLRPLRGLPNLKVIDGSGLQIEKSKCPQDAESKALRTFCEGI